LWRAGRPQAAPDRLRANPMKSKKRHNHPPGEGQADPELPSEVGQNAAAVEGQLFEPTPGLTPLQDKAVEAILQQPTLARAAAAVGVNERTLRRWMEEPVFRDAVQAARRAAWGPTLRRWSARATAEGAPSASLAAPEPRPRYGFVRHVRTYPSTS